MSPADGPGRLDGWFQSLWYGGSPWRRPLAWPLVPLSILFGLVTAARRRAYRRGWLAVRRAGVPVIVVGNLTVGGTGKTPVVAWLAALCRELGLSPGIVSRGYGAPLPDGPRLVSPDDAAGDVGDEPLLLRRLTGLPVCVHPDRVLAARRLAAEGVDILIADDGLQHYRLHRDLEIAVVDGVRRLGNGWLLPAGPLREPRSRLLSADLVLATGGAAGPGEHAIGYAIGGLRALDGSVRTTLDVLAGTAVRVVAGIGNPARFRDQLVAAGLRVELLPVPDHGRVDLGALARDGGAPIVMTAKDAVKYRPVAGGCPVWVAELTLGVPPELERNLRRRLSALAGKERT